MDSGNRRAVLAALFANAGLGAAKFVGWLITGASSMLAESVHSLADTTNQGLLLWGGVAARRAPTPSHPFGYGRERYFWSFVVALVIFSLGALFAIYEGVEKLRHPHPLESPAVAIAILGIGIALESFSFYTAIKEARPHKRSAGWWSFIHRSKNPELPVVLLEDLGALVGLVCALAGVCAAMVTGEPRYDAIGSIAIGILLGLIAVVLAIEMKSLLIGEAASSSDLASIEDAIGETSSVRRLIHLRTQHLGPDQLLVAAKVEFDPSLSFPELSDEIDVVEGRVRKVVAARCTVYIEPALYHPPARDPAPATRD